MLEQFVQVLRLRLRTIFRRGFVEQELADELQNHIEAHTERLVEQGVAPSAARTMALREMGGIEQRKEECRDARGLGWLEDFLRDIAFAARTLTKSPTFAIVAIGTIALGIGANTAIFTLVHGVLLQSLPLPQADRLVAIGETSPSGNLTAVPFENFKDWRAAQHSFEDMAARLPAGGVITDSGEPERVFGRYVSASFFPVLRVAPQLGRFFTETEDKLGGEPVIILSDGLWRRRFAADPAIVGQSIRYNGAKWTVIGILAADFDFYGRNNDNNDVFLPLGELEQRDMRGRGYPVRVTARLKPGVSEEEARAEIRALARQSALAYPAADTGTPVDLRSLLSDYVGESTQSLTIISAAVGILLLIACANVANLTLARALNREREIALRLALGASRFRIVRLLLSESILLAFLGGTLGIILATWGIEAFKAAAPEVLPRLSEIRLNGTVLTVTILATGLTGLLFGLAPAWQTARVDLETSLKSGSGRTIGGANQGLRRALVVVEFALAFILLIASGLLVQSFRNLMKTERGYDPNNVLVFRLRLPDMKYPRPEQAIAAVNEAQRRLHTLAAVKNVAVTTAVPLGRFVQGNYWIEGQAEPKNMAQWPLSTSVAISPEFFEALDIKLLAGRGFDEHDQANSAPVVVVDEQFVRRNWGENAPFASVLGRRIRFEGGDEPWREIIGVVGHVRYHEPEEEPLVQVYRPWTQLNFARVGEWLRALDVTIKTTTDPWTVLPAIRGEIAAMDPEQPLGPVHTFAEMLHGSLAPRRLNLILISAFSVSALLLSAVGIYGVMSYSVGQRRQEIGVRVALGAQKRDVIKLILTNGLRLVATAVALGLVGAFASSRFLASMLFGVSSADLWTYLVTAVLLFTVASIAGYLPARRAGMIDPLEALRCE